MRDKTYSSVHINVSQQLAEDLIHWSDEYINENDIFFDLNNNFYGREDEPHVTLLYGLHTHDPLCVEQLISNQQPFEITLQEFFLFDDNNSFNVLAIKLDTPELYELNGKIRGNLDYTNRYNYVPHITIAYLKKGRYVPMDNPFKRHKFLADNFVFSSGLGIKKRFKFSQLV